MTQTATKPHAYATDVREQYEDFPYPYHDVEKEGSVFMWSDSQSLLALSHLGWGGKRDLKKDVRILVAGCGTGNSTVLFAEELAGTNAEIVAIDLSAKSIEISKARIAKRKLANVTFHHMSILDLPDAGLGEFDIIESSGVLHHLPDPNAGLSALASVLKDDGIMSIMVYGQYGRMSIYLVQALMKQLIADGTPRDKRIEIAREFLNYVPSGHWLTVNNAMIIPELQWPDGSGIYDLFLHSTDRAYTVPQLYEWVESCGLTLTEFCSESTDGSLYAPESYNSAPVMRDIFAKKTLKERQTIAELMNGNMAKHYFFAAKQAKTAAVLADDMVMEYPPMQHLFLEFIDSFIATLERLAIGERAEGLSKNVADMPKLLITKHTHTIMLMRAIDGKRTVGEIVALVAAQANAPEVQVREQLEILYKEYRARLVVFLRHVSVAPYKTGPEIMRRAQKALGK